MLFGTFQIMSHRKGVSEYEVFQETLQEIELSEQLGFDNVWLTEHHSSAYGLCASPSVFAAAVATKTRTLGIGYAVNVTPLHNPLRLAEEISMVDNLSQGRVRAGFGPGYSPYEFSLYGADFAQRHIMHREILDIVQLAWTEDRFDYKGAEFRLQDVSIGIKPYQKPHPPIFISASQQASIEETARARHGLMVLGSMEAIRTKVASYASALRMREHQQDQAESVGHVGALRHILVTSESDRGDVVRTVQSATDWHVRMVRELASSTSKHSALDEAEVHQYIQERVTIGSPESIADEIATLKESGVEEVICWFKWGNIDHELAEQSMRLFADCVIPRFR